MIITTLATHAYRGGGALYEVLADISRPDARVRLPRRPAITWSSNPVQPKENFADRWADHPERADQFFKWIEAAANDFAAIGSERGVDVILSKMQAAFGERVSTAAAQRHGAAAHDARRAGTLRMIPGTGTLTTAGSGRPVRNHDFHLDPRPRA